MKQLVLPPDSAGQDRYLVRGPDYHYLAHVRRLEAGDRLTALCGDQRLATQVSRLGSEDLELVVLSSEPLEQSATSLVLFPFLLKSNKLDDVIRQACEAGVAAVVPVQGDHSVSRFHDAIDSQRKLVRWKAIARQAAQQSGNSVCEVYPPLESRAISHWWSRRGPLLFFHQVPLHPSDPLVTPSLHRYLAEKSAHLGLVVGPEGGLSEGEVADFQANGAHSVWLGPAILRAETASLAAVAAVNIILQERSQWTVPRPV
jgi:16S rRNA (uracil1498-N3)-methyltransferase